MVKGKGTPSFGKRHGKSHILCKRCGVRGYHVQNKRCASCGYPDAKMRSYNFLYKAKRRRTTGTGRCRYLKYVLRRESNGFMTEYNGLARFGPQILISLQNFHPFPILMAIGRKYSSQSRCLFILPSKRLYKVTLLSNSPLEKKNLNNPKTFNPKLTLDTTRTKPKFEASSLESPKTDTPSSDLSSSLSVSKNEDIFEPLDKEEIVIDKIDVVIEDKMEPKMEEKRTLNKKRPAPKLKSSKPKKLIVDFINDSISGVPTKSTQLKLENSKKIREQKKKDKNPDKSEKSEPVDKEEPEQVIMSKREKRNEPIVEKRVEPKEEEAYAPQIQIIDGKLVLNQQSVTIRQPTVNFEKEYERITEKESRRFTSATYARHARSEKWTREETDLFYDGLKQFGSDFTLLSKLFPKRDRRQIRNKFKREEKENPTRIENALNNRKVIDIEMFTQKSKEKEEIEGQKPTKGGKKTDKFSQKLPEATKEEGKEEEKDEWKTIDERQVIDEGEYVEYQYHEGNAGPEPEVTEDNFEYEEEEEY